MIDPAGIGADDALRRVTAVDLDAIKADLADAARTWAAQDGEIVIGEQAEILGLIETASALVAEVEGVRDSIVILNASLSGARDELWEKRDDPYFLGKHDGVSAALARLKRIVPLTTSDSSSTGSRS